MNPEAFSQFNLIEVFFLRLTANTIVTALFVVPPFLLLFKIGRYTFAHRRLHKSLPGRKQLWMEIRYSVSTMIIWSLLATAAFYLIQNGWITVRATFSTALIPGILAEWIGMIIIHDVYFYGIHRLMHHRWFFRRVHLVHHRSHHPTPFTSHSFHPLEALLEAAFFPIALLSHDFHIIAMILFILTSKGINVLGHAGHDFFPKWFAEHPLLKYLNTTIYHDMHHEKGRLNMGLYTNIWDRLFGTMYEEYPEVFRERKKSSREQVKI